MASLLALQYSLALQYQFSTDALALFKLHSQQIQRIFLGFQPPAESEIILLKLKHFRLQPADFGAGAFHYPVMHIQPQNREDKEKRSHQKNKQFIILKR